MMVRATGEVETVPNMARFTINLSCLDKSIDQARQCLVDRSNRLNQQLLGYGIEENDLLTGAINLNKSYQWNNGVRIFEGYRSTSTLIVTIRNIEQLDQVYTALLGDDHLELSGLNYSHTAMDSLQNEAYANALLNSQATVDRLLEDLPESKKEVMNISNVSYQTSPGPSLRSSSLDYRFGEEAGSAIAINPGILKINATLYVEYKIK